MYKKIVFGFGIVVLLFLANCGKENNISTDIAGLQLSNDTVFFDTVFTTIGSATQVFKMYNKGNDALKLSSIKLAGGEKSLFRINLSGISGINFDDVEILPNDSQYFFLEVTIDPTDISTPFVVKDSIWFETSNGRKNIKLIAWGQNAYFHRDEVIVDNTTWQIDKPHVLFGEISVALGAKLTIPAGASIHGHALSRINIWRGSSIEAIGTLEDPIVFEGDRLEEAYKYEPGQWIGIRMRPGSIKGEFDHVEIKNGFIGLEVDSMLNENTANVSMKNSSISSMNLFGILCYAGNIKVENTEVINSCGFLFAGEYGGYYDFKYCTFGGFQRNCTRSDVGVYLSNADFKGDNGTKINELNASFVNCIIYGSQDDELGFSLTGKGEARFTFDHCLMKTENEQLKSETNIINKDPNFASPGELNYQLDTLSPAIGKAMRIASIATDKNGVIRDSQNPDIGAFEREE